MTLGIHFSVKLMEEKAIQWLRGLNTNKDKIIKHSVDAKTFLKLQKFDLFACVGQIRSICPQACASDSLLTTSFLLSAPSALPSLCLSMSVSPVGIFCYLLQLKATGPWRDWAAVFSILELVFYNATRQGQTWWIASIHYCHLKNYSLEEQSEEVDGGVKEILQVKQTKKKS